MLVERKLGGRIREFEETVRSIKEYYNGDEFRGKVYDDILNLMKPFIEEKIMTGVKEVFKNCGIEVEEDV